MMTAIHLSATFAPTPFEPAWMTKLIAEFARASKSHAGLVRVDTGHVYCPDDPMVFTDVPASRHLERVTAATTAA